MTAPERAEGGGGGGEGVVSQVPKWKRDEEREDTRKNVRETTRPAHGASKHNIAAMLKLQKGNSDRPVTPPQSATSNTYCRWDVRDATIMTLRTQTHHTVEEEEEFKNYCVQA